MVEEILDIPLSGEGEHVWLQVRKRERNTQEVAESLARFAGVPVAVVGRAGLKDKRAVTTQWFSLPVPLRQVVDFSAWQMPGCEVLHWQRHERKLRMGAHRGNRFVLRLRELAGDADRVEQRLQQLREHGVPNYFGEQRFGHARNNLIRALQPRQGRRLDRHRQGLYLSAVRAFLFNEALRQRLAAGTWCTPLDGDVLRLNGSGSLFTADTVDAELSSRVGSGDLHVAAPLWGSGPELQGAAMSMAVSLQAAYDDLLDYLQRQRVERQWRPMRLLLPDLDWSWLDAEFLELRFSLPPGSFATAVVRELCVVLEQESSRG